MSEIGERGDICRLESLDNRSDAEMIDPPFLRETLADELRVKNPFSINPVEDCINEFDLPKYADATRTEGCFETKEITLIRCDTGV